MKRSLLVLIIVAFLFNNVSAQTIFTTTLSGAANWTTATWIKTGDPSNATYPGQSGYVGELVGDVHNVVISVTTAANRSLTLDASILSHIGNVALDNSTGTVRVITLVMGNNNLVLNGSIIGNGSITMGSASLSLLGDYSNTGAFTCGTGTVNYNGATQLVKATTYNNLNISGSGIKTMANANVTINGNLDVNNSTLAFNALTARNLTINGNLSGFGVLDMSNGNLGHTINVNGALNSIGTLLTSSSSGLISYGRLGDQQVFASLNYRALTFSGTGYKLIQGATNIGGNVIVNGSANLSLNSNTIGLDGTMTINATAILTINSNAKLEIADTRSLVNGGKVILVGSEGNNAKITRKGSSGGYSIIQNTATAEFEANYYHIDYLTGSLSITNGTINSVNNFSNGIFSNGLGFSYLAISTPFDLSGLLPIVNTRFDLGTARNVARTTGTGKITFENSSGAMAGESFDNDNGNPGTLVDWTFPNNVYYSKGNLPAGLVTSWSKNPDGTGANPANLTDGLSTFIVRDGHTISLDNNGDMKALALQVGEGTSGKFIIGQTTKRTLTVQNDIDVRNGGIISVGGGTNHDVVILSGSIINNGTFDLWGIGSNIANVKVLGNMSFSGANMPKFGNLYLDSSTSIANLLVDLFVGQNMELKAGSKLVDNGNTITIGGNWNNNSGSTLNTTLTGLVVFNGSGSTISAGTSTTFNNLTFSGSNGFISQTSTVNGDFNASGNVAVNVSSNTTFKRNFTIDALSSFSTTGASAIIFDSPSTQLIVLNGATTFAGGLSFVNGGVDAKNLVGDFTSTNYVTVAASATVSGAGTYTISNNLTIDGTCNWSGQIVQKGGTIRTTNAANALTLGTAELIIDGNVNLGYGAPATSNIVTINNDVTVLNGYLVVNFGTELHGGASNSFKLSSATPITQLYIRGTNNFPSGFGSYDLAQTSRVRYDWNINQVIRGGITYGELIIETNNPSLIASTKSVDGVLDVDGAFSLGTNTTLDLGGYVHTFAGNVDINPAAIVNGENATLSLDAPNADQRFGSYPSAGATLSLNNILIDQINATISRTKTLSAGTILNLRGNFNISNSSGTPSIGLTVVIGTNSIFDVAGDLPENLTLGAYCQINTSHVDFYTGFLGNFLGVVTFDVNSTINFSANGPQLIPDGLTYGNVNFSGSGAKTARNNLNIDGNLSGGGASITFEDAAFTHNIAGNWSLNAASYGVGTANGTIVLDGVNQTVGAATFNNLIIANTGLADINGDIVLLGNLTVNNGAKIDLSVRNLNLKGDFGVLGSGIFTQSSGTTTLSGSVNQNISSNGTSTFGNLVINKPNLAGAQTVKVNSVLNITLNTSVARDAGVLDISNQIVNFGQHLYVGDNLVESTSSLIATGSTMRFIGDLSQYLITYSHLPLTINNIYFSGSGNKVFGANYNGRTPNTIGNDSIIVLGNFVIDGANVNNNPGVLNSGSDVFLFGDWSNSGTFVHPGNRTVYFDGDNQSISESDFYNIDIRGTGIKTLNGPIKTNNNLTITSSSLDCNNNSISVGGYWDSQAVGATFIPHSSTVSFVGSNASRIYTGTTTGPSAGKSFNNLVINKIGGGTQLYGDLDVVNDLTITSNSLTTGIYDIWVGGNFDNQGGTFSQNNDLSILTLRATSGTKVFSPTSSVNATPNNLRGIVVNASGATYSVGSDFSINNVNFDLQGGDFVLNKKNIKVNNNNRRILVNGGKFHVDSASVLEFVNTGGGITLNSGELRVIGNSLKSAEISSSAGSFTVIQNGGNLAMSNYVIINGIFDLNAGSIDPTYNLSDGSFTGYTAGGATTSFISMEGLNCGDLSINNVTFNAGAVSPAYNIYRTTGAGVINLTDAIGSLAGQPKEKDNGIPGTLINWTYPAGFFWTAGGGADESWDNPLNWSANVVPSVNDIAYLDHKNVPLATPYKVRVNGADANALRVSLNAQGGVGVIELIVENGKLLNVVEDMTIGANTVMTQTSNTALLKVGKSWSNTGTFNHGNSTVMFSGVGTNNISSGGVGVGKAFNNVIINAPDAIYTLSNPAKFDGNVTVTDGILDLGVGTNDIQVAGDWFIDQTNGGSFVAASADVTFNGVTQTIENGIFYNLLTSNSGIKTLNSNLKVTNDITIGAATTVNALTNDLYVGRHWVNNGLYTQNGLGGVIFDGVVGTQNIDNGLVTTTFNHIAFSNAALKTFFKSSIVNGNFNVNSGSGIVNVDTYLINGSGTSNALTLNATLQIRGANNFPSGFETVSLGATSLVHYYSNLAQTVYPSIYGNIRLGRITPGTQSIKTAAGDLEVVGSLYLDQDGETTLDMASNDASMILTGGANIATGSKVLWGLTNSTLTHIGGDWVIDVDFNTFNNLVLAGTGDKWQAGDITMTGDLRVKSSIDLFMCPNWTQALFRRITGDGTGTVYIESNGRILNTRPSSDGVAIPENFAVYDFDINSNYRFWSGNGIDQTIYTGNGIQYGNILNNNNKVLTLDGVADWKVKGTLDFAGGNSLALFVDAGKSIVASGASVVLTNYIPSSSSVSLTLNGNGNQTVSDNIDNTINIANLIVSGGGTKTIGDGNDAIVLSNNVTINSGVVLTSSRNISVAGSSWNNNGTFTHTGGTVTFEGTSAQIIQPGIASAANHFNAINFNNPTTVSFSTRGADINSTLTITTGTVDFGSLLFYNVGGSILNTSGGVLNSGGANLILDGGNQNVQSPNFSIGNITIAGTGTKRLFGDWIVNGNVLIESGATLNTSDNGTPALISNMSVGGHWVNNGTYSGNTSTVTFNSVYSATDILAGNGNMYNVVFGSNNSTYTLLSPTTRFSRSMVLGSNATLVVNGNTLVLGSNIAGGKQFDVNGVLKINQNGFVKFNNQTSQSVMNVSGSLRVVGSSTTNIATITREVAGVAGDETQINILSGGRLAAKYYLIEYLDDSGMNCQLGSILDATNNLSDGTWGNVRNVSGAKYLTLESNYSGSTIRNINFGFVGTPIVNTNFNIERKIASTPITFDLVGGALGSYKFERDEEVSTSSSSGLLRWPAVTETNWLGTVSSNWHDPANWDNGVPNSTIDAIITDKSNDPNISTANAICKKLEITNGQLQLSNNFNLTTAGDVFIGTAALAGRLQVNSSLSTINVGGSWRRGTNGVFIHGSGTVNFNSSASAVSIDPLSSKFNNVVFNGLNTIFNLIGAVIVFDGNVNIQSGTVVPANNNYNHQLKGDFYTNIGATFVPSGGAVAFGNIVLNGGNQTVTHGVFSVLIVSGVGVKTFVGTTTINNFTYVYSSMAAASGSPISFNSTLRFFAGSSFDDGGNEHYFRGAQMYGPPVYTGEGTMIMDLSANAEIYGGVFHNLKVNGVSRTVTIRANTSVQQNLTISSGVNLQIGSYTIGNISGNGTYSMDSNSSVTVTGADNFPKNYSTYNLESTSLTTYSGASAQNIDGISYGNLALSSANTKTLTGNATVKGNLSFNTATLDVSTSDYTLTVGGQWNNGGTGVFLPRQGTVTFNGTVNQNINVGASNSNDFYNLIVANSGIAGANSVTVNWPTSNLRNIQNDLIISSGNFNTNGRAQFLGGNLDVSGSGLINSGSTFNFTKASGVATIRSNGTSYGRTNFTAAGTYTLLDDFTVTGIYDQNAGMFDGNGKVVSLGSNSQTVNIDGVYKIGAGGKLQIGGATSLQIGATGRFEAIGSTSGVAIISWNPIYTANGRYTFRVDGAIAAKYYVFEYMGSGGINLSSSSVIDGVNNLSDGTYSNGIANQPLLQINNGQSFLSPNDIKNVSFPTNPGGTASNVQKTTASGAIEFYNSTGLFAGETFDNDPSNLITWTGPLKLTWNGAVSTDWNNPSNWTASFGIGFVPTGDEDVIIATAVNQPILTTFGQKTANLTINNGAKIILNTANDGGQVDLDVAGDLDLKGTIEPQSANDYINIAGSWIKTGTGSDVLATISFVGLGSAKYINNGIGAFYNVTIGGTTLYQISTNTTINNDLVILSGASLGTGNNTLTVKGSWNNSGAFLPSGGNVFLNATSGTKTINNNGSLFNLLRITSAAIYSLNSNITVKSNLELINGTLNLNNYTVTVGDNAGSDKFDISGTVVANGTSKINMIGTSGNPAKLNVLSGGWLQLVGYSTSNLATVYSSTGGRYEFSVGSGAKLDAKYYAVSNTSSAGLNVSPGAIVNSINNLSDGVFSSGLSGSSYLTLGHEMASDDVISGVIFNSGAQYNVSRTSGTTIFSFVDAGGTLGGYLFENDLGGIPDANNGLLKWESVQLYTWLGLSDDWSLTTNWYNGVLPTSLADVTISAGTPFSPVIKLGSNVTINNLTIDVGARLTVDYKGILTINGDVNNAGTFVIKNQPSATASVMTLGAFIGNAQIETTLPMNRYWYMGNGVSNLTSEIYNAADLVNSFVYKYNNGWVRYTNNVTNLEVSPLVGYSHKFLTANKTITAIGPLNNSDYSITVPNNKWVLVANPYSTSIDLSINYIATIANWAPTGNVDPNIWIPTHGAAAGAPVQYATYNQSTGLTQNGGGKIIVPNQGFWVVNRKSAAGTFTLNKSSRVHNTTVELKSMSTPIDESDILRIELINANCSDEAVFAFRSQGSTLFTYADSEKKLATDVKVANLYSLKDGKILAINCLPEIEGETIIPLGLQVGSSAFGESVMRVTNMSSFLPSMDVWLDDLTAGVSYNLREVSNIQLNITTGTVNERYQLRVLPSIDGVPTSILDSNGEGENDNIVITPILSAVRVDIDSKDDINAIIEIYDLSGLLVVKARSKCKRKEIQLPKSMQVYVVRVVNGGKVGSKKIVGKY